MRSFRDDPWRQASVGEGWKVALGEVGVIYYTLTTFNGNT